MEPGDLVVVVGAVLLAAVVGALVAALVLQRAAPGGRGWHGSRQPSDGPADLDRAVETLVAVAGEQLDARTRAGASHLEARKELIDAELARMAATMGEVEGLLRTLETERARQLGQVSERLEVVARQHAELSRTTGALREALASSHARGQWGERMAADVLRAAGFVEGVNYRTQVTTRSGTRPDVTFLLPGGHVLHMDVKFPLARYLEMHRASSPADREAAGTAFLRDVRARVREVTGRGYVDPEDGTLDCVLLFVPNDQIHAFIQEHDPSLLDDALARKVVVCSPTTLIAVLAVIRQAVDAFALERTSDEILALLAGFGDQWARFVDELERLGRGIATTQRAFEALSTTRRARLERQLERIEELRGRRGVAAAVVGDEGHAPRLAVAVAPGEHGYPPAPATAPSPSPQTPRSSAGERPDR